jgi:HSP20 family protein
MSETPQPVSVPAPESSGGSVELPVHHLPKSSSLENQQPENRASSTSPKVSEVTISPNEANNTQLMTQTQPEPEADRSVFMPPIDIYDSDDGLFLLADLPGVTIESLEIQVQDNRLTLYGRVTPALPAKAQLLHQEFEWGDFLRSFILSDEVDHDRITAKLNNGVLEVFLPRTPKAEPRRIQVNRE